MAPAMLKSHQERDAALQELVEQGLKKQDGGGYSIKSAEGYDLLHFKGKIVVPSALQARVLDWYHCMLAHPGEKRLKQAIASLLYWAQQ